MPKDTDEKKQLRVTRTLSVQPGDSRCVTVDDLRGFIDRIGGDFPGETEVEFTSLTSGMNERALALRVNKRI